MAMAEMIDEAAEPNLALTVGRRMRQLRNDKNLTLKDIADRCKTTPQTVQRLETANMTLTMDWFELICAALEVEPYQLFCRDETWAEVKRARQNRHAARILAAQAARFNDELTEFLALLRRYADED